MAYLSVKLDHVAALREIRKNRMPEASHAAILAELAGADGITIHLRRDRRHIRDIDLYVLKEVVRTRMTIEIAPTDENLSRVREVKPYMVTLMPEVDKELSTQSGFDLTGDDEDLEAVVGSLQEVGVKISARINPDQDAVKRAIKMKLDAVELHTGAYATANSEDEGLAEIARIERAAKAAANGNLIVMAGQNLDYHNLSPLIKLGIDEFTVGHAIIARAVLVGMDRAVREMLEIVRRESSHVGI
jgi:pyridoxine 5-phosphate synthase